jgi:superfamily II DNA/RNA helicase
MPDIRTEVIFGGVPLNEHITLLKGVKKPHIIVGTPGRVLQLVKRGDLDFPTFKSSFSMSAIKCSRKLVSIFYLLVILSRRLSH